LEESLLVRPSLVCSARPSPSHREAGCAALALTLESRALAHSLEIADVRCVGVSSAGAKDGGGGESLALQACAPEGSSRLRLPSGSSGQLLFALSGKLATAADGSAVDAFARRRLLRACRAADSSLAPRQARSTGGAPTPAAPSAPSGDFRLPNFVDVIVSWSADGGRFGEIYALQVPCERSPAASPCPLDMHLLAPETATLEPGMTVPVTLRIRNASIVGPVSFYFVADPAPELIWLGCERSEVIRLPPLSTHVAELRAFVASPGVFNLNRFRFFVVSLPPGAGAVPASEEAPLAFAFPVERLLHAKAAES